MTKALTGYVALIRITSLVFLLNVLGQVGLAVPARQAEPQSTKRDGISIGFSMTPLERNSGKLIAATQAVATIKLNDARTGTPLSGLRPRAWLSAHHSEMVATETACQEKIRYLASGSLSARADVDLNSYWLLTLNDDKTVTFINPQVDFAVTKLENVVELPGIGADWVQSPDKRFVYISMPDQAAVAVLDTTSRKLLKLVSTGAGTKPTRLIVQPDGRYLWLGLDGSAAIAAVDLSSHTLAATVESGKGLHTLVATADSRYVYASNSDDDTITAIDTRTLGKAAEMKVGKTPVAMDYGKTGRTLYVAELNGGQIKAIDPQTHQVIAVIQATPGIVALRFDPEGRFAFAVNQLDNTVTVIDSATNKVVGTTQVVKVPDQIAFTDRYAYIRGIGSEKFSLFELEAAHKGDLRPLEIQAGRLDPEQETSRLGVAPMIVATPEGNSVMIANAPDRITYFYQEGMMVPTGTFSNYRRIPQGVMILDQSLRESAPGVYSANIRLPHAGHFDASVLLDQPRVASCFQVAVAQAPGQEQVNIEKDTIAIDRLEDPEPIAVGTPHKLRFRVTDSLSKHAITGLKGVGILAVRAPGTWQKRGTLKEVGEGTYEWQTKFPEAGPYKIVLSAPSRRIRWVDPSPQDVTVIAAPDSASVRESHNVHRTKNE